MVVQQKIQRTARPWRHKNFWLNTKKPTVQPVVFLNTFVLSDFAFPFKAVECKRITTTPNQINLPL
jgi:hypothetical protein